MKMAVAADSSSHMTTAICEYLESKGIELQRYGALKGETADYVDAAVAVGEAVAGGQCQQGLLFCFTGTGVTIVANKIPGIRAALCGDSFAAKIARLANNANVIVLPIRVTGEPLAKEIVDTWLSTEPSDEPRRINFHQKTDAIDAKYRKR